MGSCFGKHSPKDFAIPFVEEKKASLQKKQPRQAAKAEKQEKEVPSVAAAVSPSSKANHESKQQQLPSPAPFPAAASTDFQKPPSSTSLPVQKPSPSPSLFPDPVTLPPSAQTPRKKNSGEFTLNPLQKPSSPCKAMLYNMPPSPVQKKSAHRNEEEDCKFPSSARKQWPSQAEPLTLANKVSGTEPPTLAGAGENLTAVVSKGSGEEALTLTRKASSAEGLILSSKGSGVETPTLASKAPAAETLTLAGKAFSSRTNSFSRDPSPVDLSRDKARCSSPLKRSPSVKDHAAAADGPRLTRSSSGKASSPNRAGLHASERHDSMKARPLHKQSLSKEFLADTSAASSAHKRSASRDSASDFSAEIIRRPSPPKKAAVLVASSSLSASDANRLTSKRPATPSKENSASHKPAIQEPSSMGRSGRTPGQWSSGAAVHDSDNPSNTTNRNAKRKEKSPLRRTCNGMTALHSSTRITNRNADLSINSDTMSVSHFDLRGKDAAATTKKPGTRLPLREISDNSTCHGKFATSKQAAKQNARIPQDEIPFQKETSTNELPLQEEVTKNHAFFGRYDEKAMLDLVVDDFTDHDKDPLEVKAENLVMGGKSVMSAFKALEEYRLKHSNLNLESCKGIDEDAWYSRQQPLATDKETLSQPLQVGEMEKSAKKENLQQQAEELPRSRSTKRSCEPFLFPDVQSLLMSENEGMQLEGGVTMPASLSKACSILRAVADLNMGTSVYPKKKETQDEIERPNLLSFQFGEGDSHRVTMS